MSWYYSGDSSWDELDDYTDSYRPRHVSDDVYPLDYHPFRQLVDAAIGYMETQADTPLYDSAFWEFEDLAAGAEGWLHWERELKFHKFLMLPPELRFNVFDFYLQAERHTGNLQKYQHTDHQGNPCCVWDWLLSLTMCDRNSNRNLIGEVSIYMLKSTEWFEFKYNGYNKSFRIVSWFTRFLSSFQQNEAFNAIKQLNFPHAHRYNEHRIGNVIDEQDPDVQLMLRCTNLDTMAMTFKWRQLIGQTNWSYYDMVPRKLGDFLDFYQL